MIKRIEDELRLNVEKYDAETVERICDLTTYRNLYRNNNGKYFVGSQYRYWDDCSYTTYVTCVEYCDDDAAKYYVYKHGVYALHAKYETLFGPIEDCPYYNMPDNNEATREELYNYALECIDKYADVIHKSWLDKFELDVDGDFSEMHISWSFPINAIFDEYEFNYNNPNYVGIDDYNPHVDKTCWEDGWWDNEYVDLTTATRMSIKDWVDGYVDAMIEISDAIQNYIDEFAIKDEDNE